MGRATVTMTGEELTEAEFRAAIEARQRVRRPHDADLTRACAEALRRAGEPWPTVPARVVCSWSPNRTPLPKEWGGVPIEGDETPIVFEPLPAPFVGFLSVIVRADDLPRAVLDEEHVARQLADAHRRGVPVTAIAPFVTATAAGQAARQVVGVYLRVSTGEQREEHQEPEVMALRACG